MKNFDLWFSQIPNLQPDYFLFFIGINDFYIDIESSYDEIALAKKNHNMISLINFYYKQYSALNYLMRTVEGNINSYKYNLRHEASSKNSFQKIKEILRTDDIIFGTYGIHPHETKDKSVRKKKILF